MHKADLTTRSVAGFIDLLIVIGLARLPDILGFLAGTGYILVRDGLFDAQSIGKRAIGLHVRSADDPPRPVTFRESIIRNAPLALAFLLYRIPYAGWLLGPLAIGIEAVTAIGDERGMRVGDLLARTCIALPAALTTPAAGPAGAPADEAPADQAVPGGTDRQSV